MVVKVGALLLKISNALKGGDAASHWYDLFVIRHLLAFTRMTDTMTSYVSCLLLAVLLAMFLHLCILSGTIL